MIRIKSTENLAGVEISGDFYDLENLYDALNQITISEESDKHSGYINVSSRLLGFLYDLRHAFQGDRDIELLDNMMDDDKMVLHSTITPKANVYYRFNYLYPEMMFVMLTINALVQIRMKELAKVKYKEALDKNVIWDQALTTVRSFQATLSKCVKETLTPNSFARWLNFMTFEYTFIENISGQYIDMLNVKYLNMDKDKRLKSLNTFAKRIAEFRLDAEHDEIKEIVSKAAKEHGCPEGDIQLVGTEYPEEIDW